MEGDGEEEGEEGVGEGEEVVEEGEGGRRKWKVRNDRGKKFLRKYK